MHRRFASAGSSSVSASRAIHGVAPRRRRRLRHRLRRAPRRRRRDPDGEDRLELLAAVPGPARHVTLSLDGDVSRTALGSRAERIAVVDVSAPAAPRAHDRAAAFAAHDVVFAARRRARVGHFRRRTEARRLRARRRRPVRTRALGAAAHRLCWQARPRSERRGRCRSRAPALRELVDEARAGRLVQRELRRRLRHGHHAVAHRWNGCSPLRNRRRPPRTSRCRAAHDACVVVSA